MARIGLRNRLRKLEKRLRGPSPNRVLRYNPADLGDGPVSDDLPVLVSGYWRPGDNLASGQLSAFAGRFALVPDFGTTEAWEAAAEQQQRDLLAKARSRTDEPANVAPDSVGSSDSGDVPAPKRNGEKGKRFIELPNGRTFDRETGAYLTEGG